MKRASRKHPNTCHRGARSGFWWLGATLVGALWGCAPETLEQLPIERLAFVPGGQITVGSATIASRIPLLVDRFEITWEEWDGYVAATGSGDLDGGTLVPSGPPEHPAVGMDLAAAEAFAAWRSMRLPTVSEWLWIAAGPRAMTYPYGITPTQSAANTLELGLYRATPVGTFFNGRTPGDPIFDLEGNVAEWALLADWRAPGWLPMGTDTLGYQGTRAWAMGGSYLGHSQPLYRFLQDRVEVHAVELGSTYRSSDVGLRCVVDAKAWLEANADEYSDRSYEVRLRAVGRGWGARSGELLLDLIKRYPDARLFRWLLQGAQEA